MEEHEGLTQPILMRTLSAHITPMDRQIQESLNIILETKKEGNCLNQKNEWAGVKIPDLEVKIPKGVARPRKKAGDQSQEETINEEQEHGKEGSHRTEGDKRVRQQETCQTKEEGMRPK